MTREPPGLSFPERNPAHALRVATLKDGATLLQSLPNAFYCRSDAAKAYNAPESTEIGWTG